MMNIPRRFVCAAAEYGRMRRGHQLVGRYEYADGELVGRREMYDVPVRVVVRRRAHIPRWLWEMLQLGATSTLIAQAGQDLDAAGRDESPACVGDRLASVREPRAGVRNTGS